MRHITRYTSEHRLRLYGVRQGSMALRAGVIVVGLALFAMLTLSACASITNGVAKPPERAPTSTPTTQEHLATLIRRAIGSGVTDVVVTLDGQRQVATVMVTVGGETPRTSDQISAAQERVKQQCFLAQNTLWTSGIQLRKATVTILGPTRDDYADVIMQPYGAATLIASTAQTFSWSHLNADDAWERYDQVWLRPTYSPNQQYGAPPVTTPT